MLILGFPFANLIKDTIWCNFIPHLQMIYYRFNNWLIIYIEIIGRFSIFKSILKQDTMIPYFFKNI